MQGLNIERSRQGADGQSLKDRFFGEAYQCHHASIIAATPPVSQCKGGFFWFPRSCGDKDRRKAERAQGTKKPRDTNVEGQTKKKETIDTKKVTTTTMTPPVCRKINLFATDGTASQHVSKLYAIRTEKKEHARKVVSGSQPPAWLGS